MATESKALEQKSPARLLNEALVSYEPHFKNALPSHMDSKRFLRILLTETTRNPALANCTIQSVVRAALQSAQTGLEPDSIRGQAYLIPYGKECTFVPGYRGLIELAYRSGMVESFAAHVVYEGDTFELEYGTAQKLVHKPAPFAVSAGGGALRGDDERRVIGAYSCVWFKGGGHSFEFMWEQEIQAHKARYSKAAANKSSPWQTAPDEMRKKTVIRRHAKYLPQCPDLQRAAIRDELEDEGIKFPDDGAIDLASLEAGAATLSREQELAGKYKETEPGPGGEG